MRRRATLALWMLVIPTLAFACAAATEDDAESGSGAVSVKKSGDWTLKCLSGPNKGDKDVFKTEPTHAQKTDFCPDGIAQATQKAKGDDGETVWTIRCDVDKGSNGKAKKVNLDHEPSTADMKEACPGDFVDAGVEASTITEAGEG